MNEVNALMLVGALIVTMAAWVAIQLVRETDEHRKVWVNALPYYFEGSTMRPCFECLELHVDATHSLLSSPWIISFPDSPEPTIRVSSQRIFDTKAEAINAIKNEIKSMMKEQPWDERLTEALEDVGRC